jgi:hypothetical protein
LQVVGFDMVNDECAPAGASLLTAVFINLALFQTLLTSPCPAACAGGGI